MGYTMFGLNPELTMNGAQNDSKGNYATSDDFRRIFTDDMNSLFVLALLVTGDEQMAERIFLTGLGESVNSNSIYREWARSWARRTILQAAIRELHPRPVHRSSSAVANVVAHVATSSENAYFGIEEILTLEDFERFVFVMTVLERYSDRDTALLLGCSVCELRDGRAKALERLADLLHPVPSHHSVHFLQEVHSLPTMDSKEL